MFRSLALFRSNASTVISANKDKVANFLKNNKFVQHPNPLSLQNIYGIHRDDVDLTVSYLEHNGQQTVWRLLNGHSAPRMAYFVNQEGSVRLFDFTTPEEFRRFVRLEAENK